MFSVLGKHAISEDKDTLTGSIFLEADRVRGYLNEPVLRIAMAYEAMRVEILGVRIASTSVKIEMLQKAGLAFLKLLGAEVEIEPRPLAFPH